MRSSIGFFSALILALCAACGSSPEPAPEPAAPAAADDEGTRPPLHGCGQCKVVICHEAEQPRRLGRIDIKLDRIDPEGKPVSRLWKDATLELVPADGIASSVKIDVSKWGPTGAVAATVRKPDFRPAKTSWKDAKATLTAQWKAGGKVTGTKFELPVTLEACK